ncbi:MAG TPA: hypothetical protein GX497_05790 [Bacillus bacterium]|nr:hypothetical protein [Bacillus sp. (in: firmicutes)]
MNQFFQMDDRLGILLPLLNKEWHQYSAVEQQTIVAAWENSRGHIPDRIKELETTINVKQSKLDIEEDFVCSCQLNSEISELASIINDLWIWYRMNQNVIEEKIHG